MDEKALVEALRKWHISDGCLYCPQCWGQYLAQFDAELNLLVREDSSDGNTKWAREAPFCEMCHRRLSDTPRNLLLGGTK